MVKLSSLTLVRHIALKCKCISLIMVTHSEELGSSLPRWKGHSSYHCSESFLLFPCLTAVSVTQWTVKAPTTPMLFKMLTVLLGSSIKGCCCKKKNGNNLLCLVMVDRTKTNGLKLQYRKFRLSIMKNSEYGEAWNRLPRVAVASLSL